MGGDFVMYIVCDTEVYVNYFLATFRSESGKFFEYEVANDQITTNGELGGYMAHLAMNGHTLVTFNGIRYDLPILSYAMCGATNQQLKSLSNTIIKSNMMPWIAEKKYGFQTVQIDHIDIINLLPLMESLKLYGARNGTQQLQDLPYPEDSLIDTEMATELRSYCRKDCRVTHELFIKVYPEIELRMKMGASYNLDLRSKSDAQIAEAVMKTEYKIRAGQQLIKPIDAGALPTHVEYNPPSFIKFDDESLNLLVFGGSDPVLAELQLGMATETFELLDNGKPRCPAWLKRKTVEIEGNRYAVGLGGLHSQNKSESYYSTLQGGQLVDIDVRSYYPEIILNCGYQPTHMGEHFTSIYGELVSQRLEAKASGDKVTADGLKITINGTYGKLGSPYSAVYSPELMLAVTFTGQLALLMLVEMMAQRGVQCVSANTDGLTIVDKDGRYQTVVAEWQNITGFMMESTFYKSIHYRDVNNYFALTNDGKLKTKGIFREPALNKNPAFPIISKAAMAYVLYGGNIDKMIGECQDIQQFLSVRTVRGGALKDGQYLGKAVRWYTSTKTDTAINYVTNGNQVAKTDNAMPMMDLKPGIPDDLDLEWYAYEAKQLVDGVGYYGWA